MRNDMHVINGGYMEIHDYLAKPNQTIKEHAERLLLALSKMQKYGYISEERIYNLAKIACLHHDDGKANPEFQRRVISEKKIRFNPEKEVSHNVLSAYLLDPDLFDDSDDYIAVLFAIMYHHYYENPYDVAIQKKELIIKLLESQPKENVYNLKRKVLNQIQRSLYNDNAIKIKGLLHKCDYSVSGKYEVEYENDFLQMCMENTKRKWQVSNPDADWNDVQKFCAEKSDENIIIVAQTGMGKTEAGLHWIGNNKGYFVLPLRAAINAIYKRVREDILCDESLETRLSILHSESLEYYFKNLEESMDIVEYENRGKRFSMPLNISTMDQLFDFVFKYPGYEMKLVTFSYSKIVIDEIQMYSPELLAYLIAGLKRITELGGKVAIMTATLAPFLKDILIEEIGFSYGNIGVFTNDMLRHNVINIDDRINSTNIFNLYSENKLKGCPNKILVVCNTIKETQQLYIELVEKFDSPKEVNILHSRFTNKDRHQKENEIINFGQTYNSEGNVDVQSGIWIATSVVEASLDIDFDYLFTELSDLSSLFQRFGRCNRKGIKSVDKPNCFVYTRINESLLKNGSKGFIDRTLFELSKTAIQSVNGVISEKKKIELINKYLTTDNLKNSDYYMDFKKKFNIILDMTPYKYKPNEIALRDIMSKTVIPSPWC